MPAPSSPSTDEALMAAFVAAQSAAGSGTTNRVDETFATLANALRGLAYTVARSILKDEHACDDVVQEALMKFYVNASTFESGSSVSPWFKQIVRNVALDYLRKRKLQQRKRPEVFDRGQEGSDANPLQEVLAVEVAELTRSCLEQLGETYRTILILKHFEDLTYDEIAEIISVSPTATQRRRTRAAQKLKLCIGQKLGCLSQLDELERTILIEANKDNGYAAAEKRTGLTKVEITEIVKRAEKKVMRCVLANINTGE